jgi:DNA (cytosine-5)-methyltransferase 1
MKKQLTFIDLFAGAGGWSIGFENAGYEHLQMYDFNESACLTSKHNFGNIVNCVDLSKHKKLVFPKPDILVGSPPCQGFSNEGKKDANDPRNSLVWSFFDIVDKVDPYFVVFENVPGFKRSYGGKYFNELAKRLNASDYYWQDFILDSADYGVPQHRKRFVILACKDFRPNAPDPTHSSQNGLNGEVPFVTLWDAISDLPIPTMGDRIGEFEYVSKATNEYQKLMRKDSIQVFNHTAQKHSERVLDKIRHVPVGGNMLSIVDKFEENVVKYEGGYRRAVKNKPSYTAYWTRGMTSIHPEQDRFLTPRECARIQSFPDSHVFYGNTIENYTQVCNAVPPLLSFAIANSIREQISSFSKKSK